MKSIPIPEIRIIIFVLVDDWYYEYAKANRHNKSGKQPDFGE